MGDSEFKKRVEKYLDVEKGPRRGLETREVDGCTIFCFPNGICVYKKPEGDKAEEIDRKEGFTLIEDGEYRVVKSRKRG